MDHKIIKERLDEFLDGELPPQDAEIISSHVESCPECKNILNTSSSFKTAAHIASNYDPPKNLTTDVMQGIENLNKPFNIFDFLSPNFILPKLAYVTAIIILVAMLIPQNQDVTTEMLLLAGLSDQNYNWFFSNNYHANSSYFYSLGGY